MRFLHPRKRQKAMDNDRNHINFCRLSVSGLERRSGLLPRELDGVVIVICYIDNALILLKGRKV